MRTVGIVGGGQLARMMAQAAIPLAVPLRILAEHAEDSAARIAPDVVLGRHDDEAALNAFAASVDILTFDHELAPSELLLALEARGHTLRPNPAAMRFAQDKAYQRETLQALGLPVPPFARVETDEGIATFAEAHGWPVVLKAIRGGYDGRGVWVAADAAAASNILADATAAGVHLLAEAFVPIERELAVMVARRPSGETAVYPVVETVQVDGMCREVIAPAGIDAQVAADTKALARYLAEVTGVTGMLAIELFETRDGLLINEFATRPHNSGHYSIEACIASQFENHLRAVLDWPLGQPALVAPAAVTVNIVGSPSGIDPRETIVDALLVPGVHVHLYGKGPRPGRKLGHVTALGGDPAEARIRARHAAAILGTPLPQEVR